MLKHRPSIKFKENMVLQCFFSLNYCLTIYKRLWSWRNLSNQWQGTRHNKRAEETLNSDYHRQYAFVAQKSMRLSSIESRWIIDDAENGIKAVAATQFQCLYQDTSNVAVSIVKRVLIWLETAHEAPLPTLFPWRCLRRYPWNLDQTFSHDVS